MSKILFIIFLFLFCNDHEIASQDDEDESIDFEYFKISEMVDQLLETFRTKNSGRIALKDRVITVRETKIPLTKISLKKTLSLFNGKMSGLETIQRVDSAKYALNFPFYTTLDCVFSFKKLNFTSDFRKYFQNVKIFGGKARGEIEELVANVGFKIYAVQPPTVEFTSIALKSTKSIRVRVENSKLIDWLTNSVIRWLTEYSKNTILKLIEKEFADLLGQKYNTSKLKLDKV